MVLSRMDFTNENDIKDALQKTPSMLEEDLKLIGRELSTDTGFMDLLAIDGGGQLVVIEAKNQLADGATLIQLLRYMDYVDRNKGAYLETVSRRRGFPKVSLTDSPRGIVVAPGFRDELKRALRFVKRGFIGLTEISCWRDAESSQQFITCEAVPPEWEAGGVQPPPELEQVLRQVRVASVRETATQIVDWVRALPEIEERTRAKSIGFRHGKFFLYLVPQQKAIQLKSRVDDRWQTMKIKNSSEWTEDVRALIKQSYSGVGGVFN